MKKIILLLLILPLFTLTAIGQSRQGGKIEVEKIAFFTLRMDLTPDEAKVFWPLYNDYVNKRNKIRLDKNALVKYINQNHETLDDQELNESGDRIVGFIIEEAELTKNFHEKFKEILPPAKVVRIYQTEAQFNRILLEQLRNRRSQQKAVRRR